MAKLTPIERFISEIPADPRRAFDVRQRQRGLHRVTVTVPVDHIDDLKTFARFLRNTHPDELAEWRRQFHDYLADTYSDFDDAVARGDA